MKKSFLKGFVLGSLFFSTISFATVTYEAITASFPILINGEVWESDKPTVVIDGSTYLPLKAIGDVLDVKVKWNSDLRQVEIGEDESISNAETYSRKNPAPLGIEQKIKVSDYGDEYTANISIKEVIRGQKAWNKIEDANSFNSEPKDGYEYILVKVAVDMLEVKDDKAISMGQYQFKCYSSDNVEYDSVSVVEPEPQFGTKLYEGGSTSGYITFSVKETDETPKMVFGQNYDGTGGIWFSL